MMRVLGLVIMAVGLVLLIVGCEKDAGVVMEAGQEETTTEETSRVEPMPVEAKQATEQAVTVAEKAKEAATRTEQAAEEVQQVESLEVKPIEYKVGPVSYEVGQAERLRFQRFERVQNWLQWPEGEGITSASSRELTETIVLRREVESKENDGTALMLVTFEEVVIDEVRETEKAGEVKHEYVSNQFRTEYTRAWEPRLAGACYRIRMGPDTTVKEIIGLGELRTKLQVDQMARGLAGVWLTEELIKVIHERGMVQAGGQGVWEAKRLYPVRHSIVGVKTKAWERTYKVIEEQTGEGSTTLKVEMKGARQAELPAGWAEPPVSRIPWLKQAGVKEVTLSGEGCYDATGRRVESETEAMWYSIELDQSAGGKFDGMPISRTTVELNYKFEVLK